MTSLSLESIPLVRVVDPRLDLDSEVKYAVLEGAMKLNPQVISANSTATSNIQFTIPIPSKDTVVARKMLLRYYVDFVFAAPIQLGSNDSLRCRPIHSVMNTCKAQIGTTSVSVQPFQILDCMNHYQNNANDMGTFLSMSPSMPDSYQDYADWTLYGSAANPMALWGESQPNGGYEPRGGFKMVNVAGNQWRCIITEPLMVPPLTEKSDRVGLYGLTQQILVTITNNDLSYMWSHASTGNAIGTPVVTFYQAPEMLITNLSPRDTQIKNRTMNYNYSEYTPYTTSVGSIAAGASTTVTSSNIQLASIPELIYVYARRRFQDRTYLTTDTAAVISNVNLLFGNEPGILSSMSQQDIYLMSLRNGYHGGWQGFTQFSGSYVAIRPSIDIPLSTLECPGLSGSYNLQVTCTFTNPSAAAVNYDLYVVVQTEGIFTVKQQQSFTQIGVLTKENVLKAMSDKKNAYHWHQVQNLAGGSYKSFFSDLWSGAKPLLGSVANAVLPRVASSLLGKVGLGKKKVRKVVKKKRGGAFISRSELSSKLDNKDNQSEDDEQDEQEYEEVDEKDN